MNSGCEVAILPYLCSSTGNNFFCHISWDYTCIYIFSSFRKQRYSLLRDPASSCKAHSKAPQAATLSSPAHVRSNRSILSGIQVIDMVNGTSICGGAGCYASKATRWLFPHSPAERCSTSSTSATMQKVYWRLNSVKMAGALTSERFWYSVRQLRFFQSRLKLGLFQSTAG